MIKKENIFSHFLLLLSLAMPFWLSSQPLSLSLDEAREYAVDNSYAVRNAKHDVNIARKQVKENIAQGFPQIDASIDYNYFISLPTSLIPGDFFGRPGEMIEVQFGTEQNVYGNITLNQLIFDGRYFIGLQYAKIFQLLSEQNLEKSELDIKEMVSQTYYNILVGEEALKVLDSTMTVLKKTRFEVGEMYREGFMEETDFDQLTLTITDIENSLNNVSRQNELGYKLLKFQLGIDLDQEVSLTETLEDLINESIIDGTAERSFDYARHVDYRLVSSQEEMKLLGLKNERSAYYPTLQGYFNHQYNAQRNSFSFLSSGEAWFPTTSAGVSMKIPIFSSGIRKQRVGKAQLELEKIRITKEQVEQSLLLNVTQARTDFRTALENYYRERQSVDLSLKIYRKTLIKYQEGMATSTELTQQHNQFFTAESNYFKTVLGLLSARVRLDKALGSL